jgi:hypothetical protein
LSRACALFNSHGQHRNSPWFKAASVLRLNTIAGAREKIRAWAQAAWDELGINQGRGRMTDDGFVAEPVANPYALTQEASV